MNEVKRYSWHVDAGCMIEEADGAYVESEDYAALEAECERLREECEYLANENIELKMLIKNMRQQFSTSTGQEAKDE